MTRSKPDGRRSSAVLAVWLALILTVVIGTSPLMLNVAPLKGA